MIPNIPLSKAGIAVLDCEHKTPSSKGQGYPYIAIPDLRDGVVDLESARKISYDDLKEWTRRTRPQVGDVIVTRRGRVGDTAVVPVPDVALGQNLVILRSEGDLVSQAYLRWATRSPQWYREVSRYLNVGAVFSSLNVSDVLKMAIPVPCMGHQVFVAEVLDALEARIASNREVVRSALGLGQSMARKAASAPRVLGDVADVVMGSSPKGEYLNGGGEGMHFYQGVRDFGRVFPAPRVKTSSPVRTAPVTSTLFAVRAPVGAVNLAIEEVSIGRGLASIFSQRRPATLHFCLREFSEIWDEYQGGGTVFASVNGRDVRQMQIAMPEDGEGQLERRLGALLDRAVQAEQESVRLAATRDELLPLLMSGKITVKDAEKTVEEVV